MSARAPVPDEASPQPQPSGRQVPAALAALAGAAQGFVLFATLLMGLGWGGPTHVAALVQAGAAFVLIARLATRSRAAVVLVPVASAAITVGLAFAGQAHGRATACSDQVRTAAQRLAPPPGTSVEFEGVHLEGCVARTSMRLAHQVIVEHYRAEFARLGWQETSRGLQTTIGTAAVKDGITMVVDVEDPAGSPTLEVVVGDPTTATPCLIHTVRIRGYPTLTREPTTEIEPGQWMVLADADELPASVVIRDSSGSVVFEQPAHSRPHDADELLELETPTVELDVGDHAVECRARGAATTVPLRIAWAAPVPDEREKAVVLRVFETPEDWE